MKSQYLVSLLLGSATTTFALDIVPTRASSSFPECGLSCASLQEAQQVCGSQQPNLAAENCFCQYSAVSTIYESQDGTCAAECPSSGDRQALRYWFTNFCNEVRQGNDPLAGIESTPTETAGPAPTFDSGPSDVTRTESGSTWFAHHWRWVVMVIVLFLGFLTIGLVARWLKKRHDKKVLLKSRRDSKRASTRLSRLLMSPSEKAAQPGSSGQPDQWGPHQHSDVTHDTHYDVEHGLRASTRARADISDHDEKKTAKPDADSRIEVTEVADGMTPLERPRYQESSRSRSRGPRRDRNEDEIGRAT